MSQGREWDGKERRSHTAVGDLTGQIDALSRQIEEIAKTVAAMQRCFDMFRTKYEAQLKDDLESKQWWSNLRSELSASILKSIMTALLVGGAVLIALGAKQRLLEWLN